MANQTPDANVNFMVYYEGTKFIGITQVDLPQIQLMTAEVKGAGIGGAIDKPIIGMTQSMTATFNFRTVNEYTALLQEAKQHHIECWSAVQQTDPGEGRFRTPQHKLVFRGEFKNLNPGKIAVAETQDRTVEMEIVYFKEEFDGNEMQEIDKYNLVYRINGVDQLAEVRAAIGQ